MANYLIAIAITTFAKINGIKGATIRARIARVHEFVVEFVSNKLKLENLGFREKGLSLLTNTSETADAFSWESEEYPIDWLRRKINVGRRSNDVYLISPYRI